MNVTGEMRHRLGDDCATLKYSESRSSISIDIVLVPGAHRGQGVGAALISRVLLLADCSRRPVFVDARPIGASGETALQRLVSYYERFGFEVMSRGLTVVHMRRPPPDNVMTTIPPLIEKILLNVNVPAQGASATQHPPRTSLDTGQDEPKSMSSNQARNDPCDDKRCSDDTASRSGHADAPPPTERKTSLIKG